jgi:hypothetical protein
VLAVRGQDDPVDGGAPGRGVRPAAVEAVQVPVSCKLQFRAKKVFGLILNLEFRTNFYTNKKYPNILRKILTSFGTKMFGKAVFIILFIHMYLSS